MSVAHDLYLDLMMRCLTDWIYDGANEGARAEGRDWPARAHTMIGLKRLANLRMCVESTILALDGLYGKLSAGGFVIVDDFGNVPACRQAVHDFRAENRITDAIQAIDWGGAFWRRSADQGQPNGSRDAAIAEL